MAQMLLLGGLFKSPNRLRWLAHGVTEQKLGTVPEFDLFAIG